jgi:inosose dehydratase
MQPRIASSPVSFGVFEFTEGLDGTPAPDDVLGAVRDAGYAGVELGPEGYLGADAAGVAARLHAASLELAGVYLPLELTAADAEDANLARVDRALQELAAAGAAHAVVMAADGGDDATRRRMGRVLAGAADVPDPATLDEVARQLDAVHARCAARGVVAALHPHLGTHVETAAEIAYVLERSEIGLVLDTGHLAGAGAEPVAAAATWQHRIAHVHLKDVRLAELREVAAQRLGLLEMWRRALFCPLGAGDVDLRTLLDGLRASGYDGWLVVEQDRIVDWPAEGLDVAAADQRANRAWLDAHPDRDTKDAEEANTA